MVLLGALLLLLSCLFTVGVVISNTDPTNVDAFGVSLSDVTGGELFLAGAVTALVFALGLYFLARGLARSRRRRAERRQLIKNSRAEQESLAAEKARLERELEEERQRRAAEPSPGTADTATGSVRTDPGPDRPGLFRR